MIATHITIISKDLSLSASAHSCQRAWGTNMFLRSRSIELEAAEIVALIVMQSTWLLSVVAPVYVGVFVSEVKNLVANGLTRCAHVPHPLPSLSIVR